MREKAKKDTLKTMENKKEIKVGFILEGGGHGVIYTAGVLDVFLEEHIQADGVIGVSAGAIHGASYVSGQKGRSVRYTTKYCTDKRYMGIGSLLKTGDYFNVDFCYHKLPDELDPYDNDALERSPVAFFVTCTDVKTGKAVYKQCRTLRGNDMNWLLASASMPLVSRIVCIDGQELLDGGIADSIPLKAFEDMGYNKNIVVLTQTRGYQKKKNPMMPLIKMMYAKYPEFIRASAERHIIYNQTLSIIEEKQKTGEIFVIQPSVELGVSRVESDPQKIKDLYELGRKDALEKLSALKDFLKIEPIDTKN